jgi:hypothetical protein
MDKGERVWAMSIATTMESRAKKHQHQTPEMREAQKIFREWINKNKKDESEEIEGIDLDNIISEDLIDEGEGLFNPGTKDAVKWFNVYETLIAVGSTAIFFISTYPIIKGLYPTKLTLKSNE